MTLTKNNPAATILCLGLLLLTACGGGGGKPKASSSPSAVFTPTPILPSNRPIPTPEPRAVTDPPSTASVDISGSLTFDLVPRAPDGGLNYGDTTKAPARGVVIELLRDNAVEQFTVTDDAGNFRFLVDENTDYRFRVRPEMLRTESPSWHIITYDNTDNNSTYYADGPMFNSGTEPASYDLNLPSGWTGLSYTKARSAAPFAILDAIYELLEALRAEGFSQNLQPLRVFWSPDNRPSTGNDSEGDISSSKYLVSQRAIYILGFEDNDTDEYDRPVIQHEFMHYLESELSRSNNLGGLHSLEGTMDFRVAYSEAFATGFATAAVGNPIYYDTLSKNQQAVSAYSSEKDLSEQEIGQRRLNIVPGWFSEASITNLIYDMVDDATEADDELALGPLALLAAINSPNFKESQAFSSIYLLIDTLQKQQPGIGNALESMSTRVSIFGQGAFGEGETNDGGSSIVLPIYRDLPLNGSTQRVCTRAYENDKYNNLEARRFLTFSLNRSGQYRVLIETTSQTTGNRDPDGILYRNGIPMFFLATTNDSVEDARNVSLTVGDYVLEVFDSDNINDTGTPAAVCMNVSLRSE